MSVFELVIVQTAMLSQRRYMAQTERGQGETQRVERRERAMLG